MAWVFYADELQEQNLEETQDQNVEQTEDQQPAEQIETSSNEESESNVEAENNNDLQEATEQLSNVSEKESDMSDEDFNAWLASLDEANENVTEEINEVVDNQDVELAIQEKDAMIKTLADKLQHYINQNAELKVQNAELELNSEDPLDSVLTRIKTWDRELKEQFITMAKKFMNEDDIDRQVQAETESSKYKDSWSVDTNDLNLSSEDDDLPYVIR